MVCASINVFFVSATLLSCAPCGACTCVPSCLHGRACVSSTSLVHDVDSILGCGCVRERGVEDSDRWDTTSHAANYQLHCPRWMGMVGRSSYLHGLQAVSSTSSHPSNTTIPTTKPATEKGCILVLSSSRTAPSICARSTQHTPNTGTEPKVRKVSNSICELDTQTWRMERMHPARTHTTHRVRQC